MAKLIQKVIIKASDVNEVPVSLLPKEIAASTVIGKEKIFIGGSDGTPVEMYTAKMDFIPSPVNGEIIVTDADGNAASSGKSFNDTGTTASDVLSAEAVINKINALPMGSSSGFNFFLSNDNAGSFKTLSRTAPNASQIIKTTSVASTTPVLLESFISSPLGITNLESDLWTFNLFASCDVLQDSSNLKIEVYKCDDILGTNQVLLFSASNGDINSLTPAPITIEKTEISYSLLITDCLLVKILASTTHNSAVNVSLYYNDQDTNSHIHTPIRATHNQLSGLNEGDYQHLSILEKQSATRYASTSQDGLLSSANWNTFNNKQNLITSPVNNNFVFTNALGQTKDSGLSFEVNTLTGSPIGVPSSFAVSKAIQVAQQGLDTKQSAVSATTAPLPSVTASGSQDTKALIANANGLLTIDGNSTWIDVSNDGGSDSPFAEESVRASRILIKNEANPINNGIYIVNDKGSSTSPFQLVRAFDAFTLSLQTFILIEKGTVNANTAFTLSGTTPVEVDTDPLNFVPFNVGGQITVGVGLVKNGYEISVKPDTTTVGFDIANAVNTTSAGVSIFVDGVTIGGNGATSLSVLDGGITSSKIGLNSVENTKLAKAPSNTWKGNNTGALSDVSDNLTASLTESTSSVLTITGGSNALLNPATIEVKQATASVSGYLSSTDWNTFNSKVSVDAVQTLSSNGTVNSWYSFVKASGNTTITLPTLVGNAGKKITIKKTDIGSEELTGGTIITIVSPTGTIDEQANIVLDVKHDCVTIQTDGTNCFVVEFYSTVIGGGTF